LSVYFNVQGEHPDAVSAAAQAAAQAAALAEAAAQVEAAAQADQERKLQNYIALKADYDFLATEYQHLYFRLIQNEEWPDLRELICLELSADQCGTRPDTVYRDLHVNILCISIFGPFLICLKGSMSCSKAAAGGANRLGCPNASW
jgi:hypothetical protein